MELIKLVKYLRDWSKDIGLGSSDVPSKALAQAAATIEHLQKDKGELESALRPLVRYLRETEHWPIRSEHNAYLELAESALKHTGEQP